MQAGTYVCACGDIFIFIITDAILCESDCVYAIFLSKCVFVYIKMYDYSRRIRQSCSRCTQGCDFASPKGIFAGTAAKSG